MEDVERCFLMEQTMFIPNHLADVDNDGTALTLNIRFPGQYYDKDSTLHYNWFRYYDPLIGRYTKSDPIGLEAGMSTYGYVMGNPVDYTDPQGLRPCTDQEAKDFGLPSDNCWIGTDDIEGECVTAECAAGILPNRTPTEEEVCMSQCLFEGAVGGKAVEKIAQNNSDSFNIKACRDSIARIKENKVANKIPYLNNVIKGSECNQGVRVLD